MRNEDSQNGITYSPPRDLNNPPSKFEVSTEKVIRKIGKQLNNINWVKSVSS